MRVWADGVGWACTPGVGLMIGPRDDGIPRGDNHPESDIKLLAVDHEGPLNVLLHHAAVVERLQTGKQFRLWPLR